MEKLKIEFRPNYKYEDYLQWEGKWELIYGVPYAMSPSPVFIHQVVSNNIILELNDALKNCTKCTALFGLDWHIKNESDDTVVCPDNVVICKEITGKFIENAPGIIFEILSPSTEEKDRILKYHLYQGEGVKYYVIVDTANKVAEVFELQNKKYRKIIEAKKDKVLFDLGKCKVSFDFSKIWYIKK